MRFIENIAILVGAALFATGFFRWQTGDEVFWVDAAMLVFGLVTLWLALLSRSTEDPEL